MKTSSAKAKGRKLQQWVQKEILNLFPSLSDEDVRSTAMGQSGEDIQLSPAARKLFPYSVECKARANIAVYSWFRQAEEAAPEGATPMVVIRANHKKPLIILDAEAFFKSKGEK